jgi:hypothetical protein
MNWHAVRVSLKHANPLKVFGCYVYYGIRHCIDLDIFHVMYLVAASPTGPEMNNESIDFGFLSEDVVRHEADDSKSGLFIDEVERALAQREECFGAWMSHRLVSHLWLAESGTHLCQDVGVHFPTCYAYSKWAFTRDEFRGRHLHSMTKHQALNRLAERGKLGILSMVDVANLPSLGAARRSGCRRVGMLLIARVSKQQIIWASPGCRRYGIQVAREATRPEAVRHIAEPDSHVRDGSLN